MTKQEFNMKQHEKQGELLKQPEPKTPTEKDIHDLKYMRYSIKHGIPLFRIGAIRSLDRAITLLEQELENDSPKDSISTGWDNPPRFNSIEERDLYYK